MTSPFLSATWWAETGERKNAARQTLKRNAWNFFTTASCYRLREIIKARRFVFSVLITMILIVRGHINVAYCAGSWVCLKRLLLKCAGWIELTWEGSSEASEISDSLT